MWIWKPAVYSHTVSIQPNSPCLALETMVLGFHVLWVVVEGVVEKQQHRNMNLYKCWWKNRNRVPTRRAVQLSNVMLFPMTITELDKCAYTIDNILFDGWKVIFHLRNKLWPWHDQRLYIHYNTQNIYYGNVLLKSI